MKKLPLIIAALCLTGWAHAALKPGDSLSAYEIKNVENGKEYCQVCAYGAKAGKIIAFGKLNDEAFWTDLKKLQTLQDGYKDLGVFAQVIDSTDTKAIKSAADKHGIKFPVEIAVEKDWDTPIGRDNSRTNYSLKTTTDRWTSTRGYDYRSTELSAQLKKKIWLVEPPSGFETS